MSPSPHSLVQVTLNTGRIRVTTRAEADAEVAAKVQENLQGGGGWTYVGSKQYLLLRPAKGRGEVHISWKNQGVEKLAVAVVVWDEAEAEAAWQESVGRAAQVVALPRLKMPMQLPWMAAYLTPDALGLTRDAIARLGLVVRTAAWGMIL